MKKYTVYPDDTRGIGNIMNTISSVEEMKGSNCTPTLTTAKINYDNIDFPVFEIKLKGETALLTIDAETWSIEPANSVDLVATLTNLQGEAISNVDVYFYENDVLLGSSETVEGTCSYTFSSDIRGEHTIVVKTFDELQYDATSTSVHVFVYHTTSLAIDVSPVVIDSVDNISISADLSYDEGAGVVAGEAVEFYNNDTLLGSSVTDDNGEAIFNVSAHDLKENNSNVKFKAKFRQTVQYLASESTIFETSINLSKPVITLQYPIQQYNPGDTVPLTVVVTDKNNNTLEGIQLTIVAGDTTINGVTDETGELQTDYTFTSNEDVNVTITNTADNFFEAVTTNATVKCGKLSTSTNLTINASNTSISFVEDYSLVATVIASDESIVTGDVVFYEDDNIIGTVALSNGVASLTYQNSTIGEHTYYAVFNETDNYLGSNSNESSITIVKDTPKISLLTGDLYTGWKTVCFLTNSAGTPLDNKNVVISVSSDNSSFSDYSKTTSAEGKASLNMMNWNPCTIYAKYVFNGDSQYNPVSLNSTFKIKDPLSQTKYPGTITSVPATDSDGKRAWDDKTCTSDSDTLVCNDITSRSGSYPTPAKIQKNNGSWGFSIPTDATVTKIVVSWKAKNGTKSSVSACINIPAANFAIYNVGSATLTGTGVVGGKNTYTTSTITLTSLNGATPTQINDKMSFTLFTDKKNTTGNTGSFYIMGLKMIVYYIPKQGDV
jgi:hypothetical protein